MFEQPNFGDDDAQDDDFVDSDDLIDDAGHDQSGDEGANAAGNQVLGGTAKAVLEHIARSMVEDPDSVVIEVSPARAGTKLSLHVAPSDMGRVIGRRGRVAQAMRSVVRAAAAKDGSDATIDIVD